MTTLIYASPHQEILHFLCQQPHLDVLCLVESRDHLASACEQLQPDALIVSDDLPGTSDSFLGIQLIQLQKQFPSLTVIYLATPSFLAEPQAKKWLKLFHRHHFYRVHLSPNLDGDLLLRYFIDEFDVSHLEAQSGMLLTKTLPSIQFPSLPTSFSFKPNVSLPSFSIQPQIDGLTGFFKTYYPSIGLGCVALVCFYLSLSPILSTKQGVNNTMSEWESLKEEQQSALLPSQRPVLDDFSESLPLTPSDESSSANSSAPSTEQPSDKPSDKPSTNPSSKPSTSDASLLGILRLHEAGKSIGIRFGTDESVLSKGAGLDELGVGLGELGNTILYGHREEVFWDLKKLKVGDVLTLETATQTLTYEITRTRVTYPQDTSIYDKTSDDRLTLVTCHPFVYMGPTPERYVVEATRIPK